MNAKELFTDKENKYIYLERFVNDGSPSGFTEKHTTSDETNPFRGIDSFPILEFDDSKDECLFLGEHELFKNGLNFAHPDSRNSHNLCQSYKYTVDSKLMVSPTASGRTMFLRNSQYNGYLKLTYDVGRIGRVDRQLAYNNCLSSYEITNQIKKAIIEKKFPPCFAILLESASKITKLRVSDNIYEWGVIFREAKPYPYSINNVLLIPGFSLFSKDRKNPDDEFLINQFIELSKIEPRDYLINLLEMIVECHWKLVLNCALIHECQAQNCLFELNEDYKIGRMVIIDMDSIDKDIPTAKYLGLDIRWDSPYGILNKDNYRYSTRASTMYDWKLGEYVLSPLIKVVAAKYGLDILSIEDEIKSFVKNNFINNLPADYFPLDGNWYSHPPTERKPGEKREFIAHKNPKFR